MERAERKNPPIKELIEGLIEIERARQKERLRPEDVDRRTKALIEKWKENTDENKIVANHSVSGLRNGK